MSDDYGDDRYGMMRVHIASRRADLACARFTRDSLREWAKRYGEPRLASAGLKHDMAWHMAQHGLIDADGNLRTGFPS